MNKLVYTVFALIIIFSSTAFGCEGVDSVMPAIITDSDNSDVQKYIELQKKPFFSLIVKPREVTASLLIGTRKVLDLNDFILA